MFCNLRESGVCQRGSNVFVHPEDGSSSGVSVRSFSQTLNDGQLCKARKRRDGGRTGRGWGRAERR